MEGDEFMDIWETDEVRFNAYGSVVEADQNVERSVYSKVGDTNIVEHVLAFFEEIFFSPLINLTIIIQ